LYRKKKSPVAITKVYHDPDEANCVHFVDEPKKTVYPLDIMLMVPHAASTAEQKELVKDFMTKLAAENSDTYHDFMVEHFENICRLLHNDPEQDVQHHPGRRLVVQESKAAHGFEHQVSTHHVPHCH
jgi:hypothetical protein